MSAGTIRSSFCISPQQNEGVKTLGTEGLFLFSSLDTDHDLFLSPEEFKPIAEKLTGSVPQHQSVLIGAGHAETYKPNPSPHTLAV